MQPGSRIAHFEIISLVGAGGMGEVYRARDTRLGRDVAIKVLPAEYAGDPGRLRRFEQEARAVAALDHPNILAIHDVGSHEGAPYLVTELLEGESLRDRLEGDGIPVGTAIAIGIQVARALAAAHSKGIIHRDLKPSNVFLGGEGQVKLLDFGLAKLALKHGATELSTEAAASSTTTGQVVGTAGYMAPEQVRGQPTDERSDVFSLGGVLYEMLSGDRPFPGETTGDVMAAILREDPLPLPPKIPRVLAAVVRRCLEKHPEDRFASAHDVALALEATEQVTPRERHSPAGRWRLAGAGVGVAVAATLIVLLVGKLGRKALPTAPRGLTRIVVLPFENLGPPDDAYFASGMAEEITSRLANVHDLGVISRTSAFEYERKGKTVRQIGADLGVDYVLEGSVRWEHEKGRESRVRVTPQLIRVADDTHVWADRYERPLTDVFSIQSEVAESAVKAMGLVLLPRERAALQEVATSDTEAYSLYLRGKALEHRGGNTETALPMYQAAVDRDPRFAQALASLAGLHADMYERGGDRTQPRLEKAKVAAERALALRPDLVETHVGMGWYLYSGLRDYQQALREFAAARAIQPNDRDALYGTGCVLRRQAHWAEAADAVDAALRFDPKDPELLNDFGVSCLHARRYADADRALEEAIALSPEWGNPYINRAWLHVLWRGDLKKGVAILEARERTGGLRVGPVYVLAWFAMCRRDYPGALRHLDTLLGLPSVEQYFIGRGLLLRAQVLQLEGERDQARRTFEAVALESEPKTVADPAEAGSHSLLGLAYAGLGRVEPAVREARLACELMPPTRDAWEALQRLEDLAEVYATVGQPSEAVATLDRLLAASGYYTVNFLRLEPRWDPLRSDARFQALLAKYAIKD
ncbi:MAG TPA: protein kinase [Thermoanaerobaculaceae bacterium]|nr:protein kinase [Thermoanaerobaculaceae bacterium]